jgi:hypothetical protein
MKLWGKFKDEKMEDAATRLFSCILQSTANILNHHQYPHHALLTPSLPLLDEQQPNHSVQVLHVIWAEVGTVTSDP